ncbi:MAG TPA: hypothetical protein VIV40_43845 [Kofleriaceae bacterium]
MAKPLRAVVFALCLAVHGCADVGGGAVELSWKLRAATGSDHTFLDCAITLEPTNQVVEVSKIQLEWDVDGEIGIRSWPCDDDHGVTKFELPEGQALLHVSPLCADGNVAEASTFRAPAPEQRNVIVGNTVSLFGVEILLEVSSCDLQPCICQ